MGMRALQPQIVRIIADGEKLRGQRILLFICVLSRQSTYAAADLSAIASERRRIIHEICGSSFHSSRRRASM